MERNLHKLFNRKRFIRGERAQLKILSLLLISIFVPVFFVGSFLYLTIFKILADQPVIPGFVPIPLDSIIAKVNLVIFIGFVPIILLLFAWGAVVSNRLTGPLGRLQKELDDMANNNSNKRLIVRKDDYLWPLIKSINKLLVK